MEKSYLIIRIKPFYKNRIKEITKQPKLYFVDTGIRNAVAREFYISEEIKGKMFENYVLSELIKAGEIVKFWQTKDKAEVDFIIQKGQDIIPIEVKYTANRNNVERSMHSFILQYGPKKGFVVFNEGNDSVVKIGNCSLKFVNVADLLSQSVKEKQKGEILIKYMRRTFQNTFSAHHLMTLFIDTRTVLVFFFMSFTIAL